MRGAAVSVVTISLWSCLSGGAAAEDYPDCRIRCEIEFGECSNQTEAPEAEVQAARRASCEQKLASCQAQCENLKPVAPPEELENNNPNLIRK